MSYIQKFKGGIVHGLGFLFIICFVGVGYAAVSTVSSGAPLTETLWNDLVGLVNTNETNITTINSNQDGITNSGAYKVKVNIGSAEQTSTLTVDNQIWTTFPGAEKTFNLASSKTIKMRAYGSITPDGGTSNETHCGFRFVVDGVGYGNVTWGDQILGCAKSPAAVGYWCPWYIERDLDLGAGNHTINVQMKDWQVNSPGCTGHYMDRTKAKLFLEAW